MKKQVELKPAPAASVSLQQLIRGLSSCCIDQDTQLAEMTSLSRMEARLLNMIGTNNGMLPSNAASELDLVRSRITRLVDGLVAKGLVSCNATQTDGRCRFLQLTARGKRTLEKVQRNESEFHHALMKAIPTDLRGKIVTDLSLLLNALHTVKAQKSGKSLEKKKIKRRVTNADV